MAAKFQLVSEYQPAGDQPKAIAATRRRASRDGKPIQVLLGATGTGKTFTAANVIAAAQQADARPRPQQDARRPALQGVQGLLPAQRRPLLRQLLRLLPARGVHPAARHLHREGLLDQREHRPPAPRRHQRPRQPRGRHHRRQRLVHLRPRFAQRLQADDGPPRQGRDRSTATTCCCGSSTSSTSATTSPSSAASSASAATPSRSGRRPRSSRYRIELFGDEVDALADHQPDHRRDAQAAGRAVHLPGQALRHAGGAHHARRSRASSRN